jgi:WD40 repeat protein
LIFPLCVLILQHKQLQNLLLKMAIYKLYKEIILPDSLTKIEASDDGKWLAVTSFDKKLRLYETTHFDMVKTVHLGTPFAGLLKFNANSTKLVAGGKSAGVFDMSALDKKGLPVLPKTTQFKFKQDPQNCVLDTDGSHIWVVGGEHYTPHDYYIRKWNMETGDLNQKWKQPELMRGVDRSPDGSKLLIGDAKGEVRLLDAATSKVIWTFATEKNDADAVVFSKDGNTVYMGLCARGRNELYGIYSLDALSGKPLRPPFVLPLPKYHIRQITVMENGNLLISLFLYIHRNESILVIVNPTTSQIIWQSEIYNERSCTYHKLSADEQLIYFTVAEPYRVVVFMLEA